MNNLFSWLESKWNKLFRRYEVVAVRSHIGSLVWTRHHIYRVKLNGKRIHQGYRLNLADAIGTISKISGGHAHINIVKRKL